jgi:hypothetical protein
MFEKPERRQMPSIVPIAAAVAFAWPIASLAQAKDDLWEVTTKMEMPGMAMSMPAQVNRVCISKNPKDEDLIPRRDNCRVLESTRSGNKLTYKMACTGAEPMTVSGEMTYAGASYEGRMQMVAQSGGQSMQMGQTFAGKRVGDCTATK